jgi:FAD/FMN-containing dehydrogenase
MPACKLSAHPRITCDPEVCAAYAADVSGLSATPPAVARPESAAEVADLVRLCADSGVGLTPQGLRSSTTGASVASRGIVLSLERMDRLLDLDPERRIAVAQPGIVTAELKRQVCAAGLFYPPDPTSEEECTLGGNVACNASGSRTYRYGPTRRYVRALEVVLADGARTEVRRIGANKNAAGYFGLQNPVDLWIGSEGTLGVITRIELDLLPQPPGFFGALAFFRTWRTAAGFVLSADCARSAGQLQPRCLEFFDHGALELIRAQAGGIHIPDGARAAIFFEEEVAPEDELAALERWHQAIAEAEGLADETVIARTTQEQEALRALRHAVPTTMNERGAAAVAAGGRRVSTDFAVPLTNLLAVLEDAYRIIGEDFAGPHVAYGHIGNGHPHFNLLAEDAAALDSALRAARRMARRALELGGTLAAEHGIGKVKVAFYRELYPQWVYRAMRAIKETLDPQGILAPGNLFELRA